MSSPADNVPARLQRAWTDLLHRHRQLVAAHDTLPEPSRQVIFPGAFNPPHAGHRMMAQVAERELGKPVAWELSIDNVDKQTLDLASLQRRVAMLTDVPCWLTRAATFVEKARLFPQATFVVGTDTVSRIASSTYYQGSKAQRDEALEALVACECRFLVFGRLAGTCFQTIPELQLPAPLLKICSQVPAATFRYDLSSTELRKASE